MSLASHPLSAEEIAQILSVRPAETSRVWGIANQAAVLVPLLRLDRAWHLLLTQRTHSIATHKGQISFPGGRAEVEDAIPEGTALRETWEEVGIGEKDIHLAGRLDNFVTHYGVVITPVVGIIQWPVELTLSSDEVSRVFTVPLSWFADEENLETRIHVEPDGFQREVFYYREYESDVVWGITAHIIENLVHILNLR